MNVASATALQGEGQDVPSIPLWSAKLEKSPSGGIFSLLSGGYGDCWVFDTGLNRFIDEQLPDLELVILEGLKHSILIEAPERVIDPLKTFLLRQN